MDVREVITTMHEKTGLDYGRLAVLSGITVGHMQGVLSGRADLKLDEFLSITYACGYRLVVRSGNSSFDLKTNAEACVKADEYSAIHAVEQLLHQSGISPRVAAVRIGKPKEYLNRLTTDLSVPEMEMFISLVEATGSELVVRRFRESYKLCNGIALRDVANDGSARKNEEDDDVKVVVNPTAASFQTETGCSETRSAQMGKHYGGDHSAVQNAAGVVKPKKQRQPAWDIYEAVILLDAYLQYERGEVIRVDVVRTVSNILRARAIAGGKNIDEVFRNKNGINYQLGAMQYLMTDGRVGLPHASLTFREAVHLYRTNRRGYTRVLKRALQFSSPDSQNDGGHLGGSADANGEAKVAVRGSSDLSRAQSEQNKSSNEEEASFLRGTSAASQTSQSKSYTNSFVGFSQWMVDQGQSDKEAKDLAFLIATLGSYTQERGFESPDLYGCEDLNKLYRLIGQLQKCGDIQQRDKESGMLVSKALECFARFISSLYHKPIESVALVDKSTAITAGPNNNDGKVASNLPVNNARMEEMDENEFSNCKTTPDAFRQWLIDNGYSTFLSDSYTRTIATTEDIIEKGGYERPRLYGCNVNEIEKQADAVRDNSVFKARDGRRHMLFSKAVDAFVQFVHEAGEKRPEIQDGQDSERAVQDSDDEEANDSGVDVAVESSDVAERPSIKVDEPEKTIPQDVMNLELERLIGGRQAALFQDYEIYTVFDVSLYYREELLELPKISNSLLVNIERKIKERCGVPLVVEGDVCNVEDKRPLTNIEMDALDQPLSNIEPVIIRQLRQRGMHSWRSVAFNTLEELLDCPGIDLETAFVLEEHVGKILGYRIFLGRRKGEIPLVAPRESPLVRRLAHADASTSSSVEDGVSMPDSPRLMEWVSSLTGSMGLVVRAFLTEDDEYSIANAAEVTLDVAWGILARAMMRKPELCEDSYVSRFSTYAFSPHVFCDVTGEPLTTYRYLKLICVPGRKAPQYKLDEKTPTPTKRKRARGLVGTDGTTTIASRLTIGSLPSRRCKSSRMRPNVRPTCVGGLYMSNQEVVDSIDELVVDGNEYTIANLFKRLPNRMRKRIKTISDFEELLIWAYRYDQGVSIPSPGVIRFGACSRKRQVLDLCESLGTSEPVTVACAYEARYGMHSDVVRWWLRQLEEDSSKKRNYRESMGHGSVTGISINGEQLEFLQTELNGDCCDRMLVLERFRARFPDGPKNPLDERVLLKVGYERRGKKLLMRRGINPLLYFDTLITSRTRFSRGDTGFENAVFNDPLFRKALRYRTRMYDVVEYEKDSFIALDKLCETMQVDAKAVTGYSQDIAHMVGRAFPFTIWGLRNHCQITHPLDVLATEGGVSDYLFESLLDIDPHVQTCSLGHKRCFIVAEGQFTAGNFLECVLEINGYTPFDDLLFLLRANYGIEIAELPLHNTIRQSSLYYDDLTDSVYNSRGEWKEMVESELA